MINKMKIKGLFTLFLAFSGANLFAGVLTLQGVYQGKNLYVQNPFTGNMKDFCTNEVVVNDKVVLSNVQSSAFEIDLSFLSMNDPVTVSIKHKDDCKPKVLNPQVIKASSNFNFQALNIDAENVTWVTKGEKPRGRFFVEQFKNNAWVTVREHSGKENPIINNYIEKGTNHSGLNKYRVKYLQNDGQVFYSQVMEFTSDLKPIEMYPKRVTDKIYLSREADYEILDQYGNVISKGTKKEIDLIKASTGVYYLNVDNQTIKFFKK